MNSYLHSAIHPIFLSHRTEFNLFTYSILLQFIICLRFNSILVFTQSFILLFLSPVISTRSFIDIFLSIYKTIHFPINIVSLFPYLVLLEYSPSQLPSFQCCIHFAYMSLYAYMHLFIFLYLAIYCKVFFPNQLHFYLNIKCLLNFLLKYKVF